MPSSIRSETPRLVNVRTNSSPSIHIDREVTVSSSVADGWGERAIYSTMPSISSAHGRAQSSPVSNTASASAPVLNRWASTSKMSDFSKSTHDRGRGSRDTGTLDSNRESMRALADFLRRSEPPPSNLMSRPDSDAGSLHSMKKSTFKIFGRQKSKKATKGPKLLQLPDSAVAAKTTGGARHIAISIPIEYDHLSYDTPASSSASSLAPPPSSSQPKLSSDRATVTVLKPVAEVRESGSSLFTQRKRDEEPEKENQNSRTETVTTPSADVLSPETIRTLKQYYMQSNRQQKNPPKSFTVEGKLDVNPDRTVTHKSYVAVSPYDTSREDTTRADPRHSGGTAYSTASFGTYSAHSRGPSSSSSAPSATPISVLKLELPPRKSSIVKVNLGLQTELANAFLANKVSAAEDPARVSSLSEKSELSAGDSSISGRSNSQSPPTAFGTAEMAQSHHAAAGLQTISRSNTPESLPATGPAPNRHLPDVPESPCVPSFYPSPSPQVSRKNSPTIGAVDDTVSRQQSIISAKSTGDNAQKSRQDRVKARKQRDLAMHKDKSTKRDRAALHETPSPTSPQSLITTSGRNSKRRSVSQETARTRPMNSITEIMLVADLAPFTGLVRLEDLPLPPSPARKTKLKVQESDSISNMSARGTHTPPSSKGSESDTVTQHRSLVRSPRSGKKPALDARRNERRVKRNLSLREKEMDARLVKIERDNTMLINTLSGFASSFGDLSRLPPVTRMRGTEMLTEVERMREGEDGRMVHGELQRLDPGDEGIAV